MSRNKKDGDDSLVDALWAYRMAFKTLLDTSAYRVIYGKPCHLLSRETIKLGGPLNVEF